MIATPALNVFLREPDFVDTGEEQNLDLLRPEPPTSAPPTMGQVVALRRGVMGPPAVAYQAPAEWVGFVKVSRAAGTDLAVTLDRLVRQEQVEGDYETALDALLPRHRFVACSTDGLPWIEIDFPQDLQAAETEVLPRIAGPDR